MAQENQQDLQLEGKMVTKKEEGDWNILMFSPSENSARVVAVSASV